MSGAVTIPLEAGKHGTLQLVFKFGTMVKAEQELGKSLLQVMSEGEFGFDAMGAVFWAAMQPSHQLSRAAAEEMVDEIGIGPLTQALTDGVKQFLGLDKAGPASGEGKAAGKAK